MNTEQGNPTNPRIRGQNRGHHTYFGEPVCDAGQEGLGSWPGRARWEWPQVAARHTVAWCRGGEVTVVGRGEVVNASSRRAPVIPQILIVQYILYVPEKQYVQDLLHDFRSDQTNPRTRSTEPIVAHTALLAARKRRKLDWGELVKALS